ncbi:Crp/Fnr family transcriptional regulator [Sphingomonas sp. RS2018]
MVTVASELLTSRFLMGRRRRQLRPDELQALEACIVDVRTLPARTTFVTRGEPLAFSTLLIEGWISRHRDTAEGQRQGVGLQVPGDFVDLHGYPLGYLDHDLTTITACRIGLVPHERLSILMAERPHLVKLLWFSTLLDAAMHREWIFRIGRMGAAPRVAHLICELHARLAIVGLATDAGFDFPLTQQDLGEACGLTNVHTNRVLATLRKRGLVSVARRRLDILDLPGLHDFAEFDPDYLFLEDDARRHSAIGRRAEGG